MIFVFPTCRLTIMILYSKDYPSNLYSIIDLQISKYTFSHEYLPSGKVQEQFGRPQMSCQGSQTYATDKAGVHCKKRDHNSISTDMIKTNILIHSCHTLHKNIRCHLLLKSNFSNRLYLKRTLKSSAKEVQS